MAGVARRSWARNENAISTIKAFNDLGNDHHVTEPLSWMKKLEAA